MIVAMFPDAFRMIYRVSLHSAARSSSVALGSAPGVYWEAIVRATRANIWSDMQRNLPVARAGFGADAGLVGAGLVAMVP